MPRISRRDFLIGTSAAVAVLTGARLTGPVLAARGTAPTAGQELLVVVFLRFGWDALSAVPPLSGPDRGYYEAARPLLQVPVEDLLPLDAQFGFHPSLEPLYPLYKGGKLAVIHAAGLTTDTRSHFDAQQYVELGTPGSKSATQGWLTRHLATAPDLLQTTLLPALATGDSPPTSLLGSSGTAVIESLSSFALNGALKHRDAQKVALRAMYDGAHWLYRAGTTTLDAIDWIADLAPETYAPANGALYPPGRFGDQLQIIAQIAKLNSGLRVATVDLGGWDTHTNQGEGGTGQIASLLSELAHGLAAIYTDLGGSPDNDMTNRLTVVVHSEFGRRLRENINRGTDHGHGGAMLVLGGHVNGGAVYSDWPGLRDDQLYNGADLAVTTDFRQVLAEITRARPGSPNLDAVFPGLGNYRPLGLLREIETA